MMDSRKSDDTTKVRHDPNYFGSVSAFHEKSGGNPTLACNVATDGPRIAACCSVALIFVAWFLEKNQPPKG
jgi:hypothetical protein